MGPQTASGVSASSVTITIGTSGTPTALQGNWVFTSTDFGSPNTGVVGFCILSDESGCPGGGILGDGSLNFDLTTISLPYTASGASIFNDETYGVLVVTTEGNADSGGTVCIGEVATCGTFTISGGSNPNPNAVPEPATGGMVMLGMTGLAWFARRRKV